MLFKNQQSLPSQDLSSALSNLQSSLYVLSNIYQVYIEWLAFCVLALIFYKLGNLSIRDQVLNRKNKLSSLIRKKSQIQQKTPVQIQRLQTINQIIIIISLIIILSIAIAHYSKYIRIVKYQILLSGIVLIFVCLLLAVLNVYKFYLTRKVKQVASLEIMINEKTIQFQMLLGTKVVAILKNNLCRDKLIKYNVLSGVNQCQKLECKELRILYKNRNEAIQHLIQETLDFQWCSVCKKKQAFDELLSFEIREYNASSEREEEEVKCRINYLMEGLLKMRDWVKQTSPCNCSKLYWTMSTQLILAYKKSEKVNQSKIIQIQNRHKHENKLH